MDNDYKSLNPKSKKAMYIAFAIYYAVLALAVFGTMFILESIAKVDIPTIYWIIVIVLMAATLVYVVLGPIIFYRHYRYIVNDEKVDVRRGILILSRTMVPIERIHQVEIKRGPINNIFGLADVQVLTAGGVATIQFLDVPEAERIAEDLNKVVNTIVRDRKKDD